MQTAIKLPQQRETFAQDCMYCKCVIFLQKSAKEGKKSDDKEDEEGKFPKQAFYLIFDKIITSYVDVKLQVNA